MLYVEYKTATGEKRTLEWHVGTKFSPDQVCLFSQVVLVQADGDELAYILDAFKSIPYHRTARVQKWRGDFANFIADNMRYK